LLLEAFFALVERRHALGPDAAWNCINAAPCI
jgi:hypothetical protein